MINSGIDQDALVAMFADATAQSYSTLVSGVLIGMSEGLQPTTAARK